MTLHHSPSLHKTLWWLYFTLLYSTYLCTTSPNKTLLNSIMVLLHSTTLYMTLPWFYFTLLDFRELYHGSTSLYMTLHKSKMGQYISLSLTLHNSTMPLLHCTWLYITLPWLYFTLLDSTALYLTLHNLTTSLYLTLLCSIQHDHGSTSFH